MKIESLVATAGALTTATGAASLAFGAYLRYVSVPALANSETAIEAIYAQEVGESSMSFGLYTLAAGLVALGALRYFAHLARAR